MNKLTLFREIKVRTAFYFGDRPKRIWLKISDTQAILIGHAYKVHEINLDVLVFHVAVYL